MQSNNEKVIGFIGLGVMGKSMARNLINEGFNLVIYTRTKEKAADLVEMGAKWVDSPRYVAQKANTVITMVGYPSDVEEIYLGEEGLINHCNKNTYLIDMTTSTPTLAKRIFEVANEKGLHALDAPVSGGDIGAREGKLAIMVGGNPQAFEACSPVFEALGKNIVYQGEAGSGQHTKMCNQIAIASNMVGICEAIVYAEKAGLNPETVLQSISTGAAGSWSLSNLAPRILKGDFAPGFYIKHFIKDMKIALEEAENLGIEVPGLFLAKKMYEKLAENGEENSGTQALYKYW
ncbi:NAD(P)-dependent oxidoreductase [Pseudoneobacillus rhizosphaerae]|uniref:2-hydroxy-3-oxopropionate reductase n=1 Tax=Pseudoneobacillus rhizosphaerae TaxID=2880968 RepID=A0A9C7GA50_9BACI|nr:NAD(P)-dependent oxidoreductase [Pseudoneobacillus rhizosphaerae]CAG9608606.1 2-hydroxy-3-oxopropionate reductase [Pseudoneobacillus rhizosphaerae]